MPYLSWNESLELGHAQIDHEHKGMLGQINRLFDAVFGECDRLAVEHGSGSRSACIAAAVAAMRSVAAEHFRSEEALMSAAQYPALVPHAEQHAELLEQLAGLEEHFHSKRADSLPHAVRFLREWFEFHVDTYDRALVRWLDTGQGEPPDSAGSAASAEN
ncbi:MAG TPA: hemerythrin family protein [Rhodocyclaceae bacterium]|nr:hemerythrin family protein [Rhodocyclaceae bacterium]